MKFNFVNILIFLHFIFINLMILNKFFSGKDPLRVMDISSRDTLYKMYNPFGMGYMCMRNTIWFFFLK